MSPRTLSINLNSYFSLAEICEKILECEDLIRKCLTLAPERRANFREILDHPWLKEWISIENEQFKTILDRKLNNSIVNCQKNRNHRQQSTIKTNNQFSRETSLEAEIDVYETIQRCSSANDVADLPDAIM